MVALDPDGYLERRSDWNAEVAQYMAALEEIELTEAHWELIPLIQSFYEQFDHSPANRALAKWIKQHVGADKAKTLYLMGLFPNSPPKQLARIAGLPRPDHCL